MKMATRETTQPPGRPEGRLNGLLFMPISNLRPLPLPWLFSFRPLATTPLQKAHKNPHSRGPLAKEIPYLSSGVRLNLTPTAIREVTRRSFSSSSPIDVDVFHPDIRPVQRAVQLEQRPYQIVRARDCFIVFG